LIAVRIDGRDWIMDALAEFLPEGRRPSSQSFTSSLAFTLVIGLGFAGGVLSVLVGELCSSGMIQDVIAGWQTAGAEVGGAFNGVSHGEIEMMKRGGLIAMRALA
jgi:hypothetical protein